MVSVFKVAPWSLFVSPSPVCLRQWLERRGTKGRAHRDRISSWCRFSFLENQPIGAEPPTCARVLGDRVITKLRGGVSQSGSVGGFRAPEPFRAQSRLRQHRLVPPGRELACPAPGVSPWPVWDARSGQPRLLRAVRAASSLQPLVSPVSLAPTETLAVSDFMPMSLTVLKFCGTRWRLVAVRVCAFVVFAGGAGWRSRWSLNVAWRICHSVCK